MGEGRLTSAHGVVVALRTAQPIGDEGEHSPIDAYVRQSEAEFIMSTTLRSCHRRIAGRRVVQGTFGLKRLRDVAQ